MSKVGENVNNKNQEPRVILKQDLRLFEFYESRDRRYVQSDQHFGANEEENAEYFHLGADLAWENAQFQGGLPDLRTISAESNLEQAILHRLRTNKGELSDTGHPEYGSELYKMIGEPNSERTRGLIKLIVRDALLQEPRIKEIISIVVTPRHSRTGAVTPNDLLTVDIEAVAKPISGQRLVGLALQFSLEGGK